MIAACCCAQDVHRVGVGVAMNLGLAAWSFGCAYNTDAANLSWSQTASNERDSNSGYWLTAQGDAAKNFDIWGHFALNSNECGVSSV